MSFFKELKEDIAQSVSELTESIEDEVLNEPEEKAAENPEDLQDKTDAADLTLLDGVDAASEEPEEVPEPEIETLEIPEPEVEEPEEPEVAEEEPEVNEIEENKDELSKEEAVVSEELNMNAMDAAMNIEEDSPEVTVITKGTTINGGIKSDTSLVVKGTIEGDVECQGKLTITGRVAGNTIASEIYVNTPRLEGDINSKGIVKIDVGTVVIGNVNCTSVVVAGAVKGDIAVNGPVVVDSTAVVKGAIKAKSIQINSGAVIDGHCSLQFADVDLDSFFE
ncbi:MAG: polymer-forming cytoskeletal protein [Lachnospiraceae bacterium]|nr:polymer-forming cytoskeletal protein [Lachnospiraceae bacterium]